MLCRGCLKELPPPSRAQVVEPEAESMIVQMSPSNLKLTCQVS